jgi:pyruvate/2-oxoglutarate/acetoin dehydrogenase E1 component
MGMGIGAAMTGLRPIVEGMNMGFLLLAFNQVRQAPTRSQHVNILYGADKRCSQLVHGGS